MTDISITDTCNDDVGTIPYSGEMTLVGQITSPEPPRTDGGLRIVTEDELDDLEITSRPKLKNCLEDDHFISEYTRYGTTTCDAFPEYHYAAALVLLSFAIDRNLVLKLKQEYVYPNVWCFLLGTSTVSRKTTAVGKAEKILKEICPCNAIPKAFTPASLIEFLDEYPRSYLVKDEVGQLLSSMRRQYMQDARDFFCEIFDNRDFTRKLRTSKKTTKTDFHIHNPYVIQLFATTNSSFREYTTTLDLTSGWLLRFLYFSPNYKKISMPFAVETKDEADHSAMLHSWIHDLYNRFHEMTSEKDIVPEPEAMAYFQEWQLAKENELIKQSNEIALGLWGRLQVYALKLAILFTVGRKDYTIEDKIPLNYMQEACRQIDEYFLPVGISVTEEVGRKEQKNLQDRIIGTLERNGGKMTRPQLLRSLHMKVRDIEDAIEALEASEEIEIVVEFKEGKKPVTWYILRR